MAYEIPDFYLGVLPSDVNLTAEVGSQYIGVAVGAASNTQGTGTGGAAVELPSAGSAILGIIQNNPQIGEAAQVMVSGVSKALSAGTIAIGAILMVNSAGAFVTATSGNYGVAQALESAVTGDVFTVLLKSFGKQ